MEYEPPLIMLTEKLIFLEQMLMEAQQAGDEHKIETIKQFRRDLLENYGGANEQTHRD